MKSEILIKQTKTGRKITINGVSVTPVGEWGLILNAKLIERMSPCELSYFRPIIVGFDRKYSHSKKLPNLTDDISVSFVLVECQTVSARVIMLTPEDEKHRSKRYHNVLKKVVKQSPKLELSKNTETLYSNLSDEEKKKNAKMEAVTEFTLTFFSNEYVKIYSALNNIIGELKSETKKQLK